MSNGINLRAKLTCFSTMEISLLLTHSQRQTGFSGLAGLSSYLSSNMELNGLNSKIDPFILQTDPIFRFFFVSDRRRSNWIVLMRIAARLKRDANLEKNVWK